MTPEKTIPFAAAAEKFAALRREGRRIVQCHGTFDLVHPGHVIHLEEAKKLGDILVVTVTGETHVNKGPGRPFFNDALRARSLAALACVDFVVVVPHPAAVEAIEAVRPHIYCKGLEYSDPSNDVTGNIHDDIAAVQALGGEILFLGETVSSSTRLINSRFAASNPAVDQFCRSLARRWSPREFAAAVEGFSKLRVLVVGDTIYDKYSFLKFQGLASKNRILSGRHLRDEIHAGGALAVLRHIAAFAPAVRFLSLLGTEDWVDREMKKVLPPAADATLRSDLFTTVVKQRFVEPEIEGKELTKLFAVNHLDPAPPPPQVVDQILERLREEIDHCDVVVLADFGHGLLQPVLRNFLQERSPFLALNCQTNSANHGFNILPRKYQRADIATLDEQELLLACGERGVDFPVELEKLRRSLSAKSIWLTRGPVETLGLDAEGGSSACPPLSTESTDTLGAGDAFFSLVALAAAAGLPLDLCTFLGQLAGAQAVRTVGNREPVSKSVLLKGGMSLLNRDPL